MTQLAVAIAAFAICCCYLLLHGVQGKAARSLSPYSMASKHLVTNAVDPQTELTPGPIVNPDPETDLLIAGVDADGPSLYFMDQSSVRLRGYRVIVKAEGSVTRGYEMRPDLGFGFRIHLFQHGTLERAR